MARTSGKSGASLCATNFESKDVRHIGPTVQGFRAAFVFDNSGKILNTVDAQGVALAAIQGLDQMIQEKDKKIEEQRNQIQQFRLCERIGKENIVVMKAVETKPFIVKALLVYPEFPDTYWSFKHALSFERK